MLHLARDKTGRTERIFFIKSVEFDILDTDFYRRRMIRKGNTNGRTF